LGNEALARLLPAGALPATLADLPAHFIEPEAVSGHFDQLVALRRPWRGEAQVRDAGGVLRPMLVRADPVFSSPGRILGFIVIFNDASERDAAATARRHFQGSLIERHRGFGIRLDTKSDLVYRNLLSTIVENAQLAALEITDGVDAARIPGMLDSVRASVSRTAEVLKILVWHASREPKDGV